MRTVLRRRLAPRAQALHVHVLGLDFPSPLGLAAGFDKNATAYEQLALLGFGYVEIGTVTALPQAGNEGKTIFRAAAFRALRNRMGFPNLGADAVRPRLASRPAGSIVGVNVGKSRAAPADGVPADYERSIRLLAPVADYLVINVSSPNTPGLRGLQAVDQLEELVACSRRAIAASGRAVPLLVKISPDLSDAEIDAIADLALRIGLDGIVAVNTTIDPTTIDLDPAQFGPEGFGGISGAPLKERSLAVLRRLRARVGDSVVLVSVGGIETPDDAWERITAGASLLQAYTGFVYGGPLWPHRINRGLERRLRLSGMATIAEAVGSAPQPVASLHA
jgi:dihydroorotate dehydrogenase